MTLRYSGVPLYLSLFLIRRLEVNAEEEDVTGWIPLSIKISFDSGEIQVTKIDEVRTLAATKYLNSKVINFISPMLTRALVRLFQT